MPGMDGRELAAKAKDLRPGLAVLFTTGYVRDQSDAARFSPSDHVIRKPFTVEELSARIRDSLASSQN
jgi:CheY-like chemotaxis protein